MPRRVVVAVDGDTPDAVALLRWTAVNVSAVASAVAAAAATTSGADAAAPEEGGSAPAAAAAAAAAADADAGGGADAGAEVGGKAGVKAGGPAGAEAGAKAGAEAEADAGAPPEGQAEAPVAPAEGAPAASAAEDAVVVTILHATLPPYLPIWGPDPLFTSDALLSEILAEDRRRSLAAAASLRAHAGRLHLPAQVVTRPGDPREVVPEYIAKAGADLLVVGSRGLSGLSKLLLGSVSSYLVANVDCPVVVYRPAKENDA